MILLVHFNISLGNEFILYLVYAIAKIFGYCYEFAMNDMTLGLCLAQSEPWSVCVSLNLAKVYVCTAAVYSIVAVLLC